MTGIDDPTTPQDLSKVEAWLLDLSSPAPSAADLAALVARQAKRKTQVFAPEPSWARDAMLRLANVALVLHASLQGSREANAELRREKENAAGRLVRAHGAMQDAAHTAVMAIEKLQEVQPIVIAALALLEGGDIEDVEAAAQKYKEVVKKRS